MIRLFHLNQLLERQEIFKFIVSTRTAAKKEEKRRKKCDVTINGSMTMEEMVFSEDKHAAPNHVIVMDDLINEVFNSRETMTLLMTKFNNDIVNDKVESS